MPTAIEFDFKEKVDGYIALDQVRDAINGGRFVWLDIDGSDVASAREVLRMSVDLEESVLDECLSLAPAPKYDNRPGCLHLVLVGCSAVGTSLDHHRVDVIVGESYCVTIHRERVAFLERVKTHYHEDFVRYAKSPGFLLYEMWDALIDGYEDLQSELSGEVEVLQKKIFTEFDDHLLAEFATIGNSLLHFRKVLAPSRNVLDELATRKSRFVPEGTQPFLGGMVPRIERILQDIMVNREILSDALNLHVAIGDHKLNRIMEKLTVVTVIFLPLTFLCGVYGMNFEFQPEFKWAFGYAWFWGLVVSIVLTVLIFAKRAKLL